MEQPSLNLDYGDLFEQVCTVAQLRCAFRAVRRNGGASGIDGVSITDYEKELDVNLAELSRSLRDWSYKPQPVKRVKIPKPGSRKKRILGIPCVRDRVVQTALKQCLEPIFDPRAVLVSVPVEVKVMRCSRLRNWSTRDWSGS